MNVKTYRGITKSAYRIVIPSNRNLSDLSETVQEAAKNLGGLHFMHEHTLNHEDAFHKILLEQIATEGAAIWKVDIRFDEIAGKRT